MKHDENLLVVAMEESAELQQEFSKALRFGTENHHPDAKYNKRLENTEGVSGAEGSNGHADYKKNY